MSGAEMVGLAFHIGARVAEKARADEVLVSSAVKDLMAQSAVRFMDRGVHRLKGVPERWRLYRVEQK
jgi:class 3 adenylate cyclase